MNSFSGNGPSIQKGVGDTKYSFDGEKGSSSLKELEDLIQKTDGDYIKVRFGDFQRILAVMSRMALQIDSLNKDLDKLKTNFNSHDHKDGEIMISLLQSKDDWAMKALASPSLYDEVASIRKALA